MPITAALSLPLSATIAQMLRSIMTVVTIASVDPPSPASRGTNPTMMPPPMIAAKITASTELRPSSVQ